MKKIIAFLLLAAALFSLVGCSDYEPVKSTDEEAETVLTITFEGERYEVPYELYRFFFLNYKSEVGGEDDSVWSGEDKDEYIDEIDGLIYSAIAEIYSVFHLCIKADIDPHSSLVNDTIETYIKASVEGGTVGGNIVEGHDGDYDAYLASLKERNMNYSVQEILFRYAVCSELLDEEYSDSMSYTMSDVERFYYSDECVRTIQCYFRHLTEDERELYPIEVINGIRDGMAEHATGDDAVCDYIMSQTNLFDNISDGVMIARHSLDPTYYSELTAAAFALDSLEVSEPIEVVVSGIKGYYILYRATKSTDHFERCYDDVEAVYVQNVIGRSLFTAKEGLRSGIVKSSALKERDYSKISME